MGGLDRPGSPRAFRSARAARAPFERSNELGGGEATVVARYAQYCARCGRDRPARAAMKRALVLDRLNPLIHRAAGSIEYAARRWEDSIGPARRALSDLRAPRARRSSARMSSAAARRRWSHATPSIARAVAGTGRRARR